MNELFFSMPVDDTDAYITTLLWRLDEKDKIIKELQNQLLVTCAIIKIKDNKLIDALRAVDEKAK